MHFLRTLNFSTLYASAAFAANIPVGGFSREKDIEIAIKIQPILEGAAVGVSERSVL